MRASGSVSDGGYAERLEIGFTSPVVAEMDGATIVDADVSAAFRARIDSEAKRCHGAVLETIASFVTHANKELRSAIGQSRCAKAALRAAQSSAEAFGDPAAHPVISGLAIAVILTAEWVFGWTSLPAALDVRQHSFAGVCLATLPVAATMALGWVFDCLSVVRGRLLFSGARASGQRTIARVCLTVAFVLALVAVTLANLAMMNQIAAIRALVAVAALAVGEVVIDQHALDVSQRVLSLVAVVDAAILVEVFQWECRRRRAMKLVSGCQTAWETSVRSVNQAMARRATAKSLKAAEQARADLERDAFLYEARLRLQQAEARLHTLPLATRVNMRLGHPLDSNPPVSF